MRSIYSILIVPAAVSAALALLTVFTLAQEAQTPAVAPPAAEPAAPAAASASAPAAAPSPLPEILREDFEQGGDRWELLDAENWRVADKEGNHVLSQFADVRVEPPHRSPYHIALIKDVNVGDFELTVRVLSTRADYNHRDVCLFFGFQDRTHYYYAHLGKTMDPRANQIFIVDEADRTLISTKTTDGIPWDDAWHTVRIRRNVESGSIEVFFDDMETPVMTAENKRFTWGQIGLGTFDDTADWDEVVLKGNKVERPAE